MVEDSFSSSTLNKMTEASKPIKRWVKEEAAETTWRTVSWKSETKVALSVCDGQTHGSRDTGLEHIPCQHSAVRMKSLKTKLKPDETLVEVLQTKAVSANNKYKQTLVNGHKKDKGSPYSITERRVSELIPVLGSQPAGYVSHKPGGRLPLLSARPAVTLAALKRSATILLLGEQRHNGCEQFA